MLRYSSVSCLFPQNYFKDKSLCSLTYKVAHKRCSGDQGGNEKASGRRAGITTRTMHAGERSTGDQASLKGSEMQKEKEGTRILFVKSYYSSNHHLSLSPPDSGHI